jgi:heme oxygenase
MSPVQELKAGTEDLHQRIETVVPLMDPQLTVAEYMDYLERLWPFYRRIEACLGVVPGLRSAVRDLDERWKTGLLAMDLRGGSARPDASRTGDASIPHPRNVPEALGCLYVLEGSTLGAQILIRAIHNGLGDKVAGRTHFLECYGAQVGEKWRRLCAALNAELAEPNDLKVAVAAARSTFAGLHDWLEATRKAVAQ